VVRPRERAGQRYGEAPSRGARSSSRTAARSYSADAGSRRAAVAVPPPIAAPKPPAPPLRPPPKPAPTTPDATVYKSGVIDGMAYTLFMDGSIEAELPQGKVRFASVDELQKYLTTRQ
jgi:hypothetical protein